MARDRVWLGLDRVDRGMDGRGISGAFLIGLAGLAGCGTGREDPLPAASNEWSPQAGTPQSWQRPTAKVPQERACTAADDRAWYRSPQLPPGTGMITGP